MDNTSRQVSIFTAVFGVLGGDNPMEILLIGGAPSLPGGIASLQMDCNEHTNHPVFEYQNLSRQKQCRVSQEKYVEFSPTDKGSLDPRVNIRPETRFYGEYQEGLLTGRRQDMGNSGVVRRMDAK